MAVEDQAKKLQALVNERVAAQCAGASPLQFSTIAEQVARETLGDQWEWLVAEPLGGTPQLVITRFNGFNGE